MADPSVDLTAGIGSALGGLLGAGAALGSTQAGVSAVGDLTNQGAAQIAPYNFTGANYLGPVGGELLSPSGSSEIGLGRINAPSMQTSADPVNFQDFAKNYNMSEGAQYLQRTAEAAQNSTAAAKGGLLSGANLRAQTTMTEQIANQDLLDQYKATAAGQQQGWQQSQASQQQDFAQREQAYQNMYGQEAMGLQAGIAEAGTYAQGARAIGSLYGTQAQTTSSSLGSGFGAALGNIFTGLTGLFH